MRLKPSEIRFSQDSINNCFRQGSSHRNTTIGETLDDICEGRCSIRSIPLITVVNEDGQWITEDNRRLWVFRQLERLGKCDTIPVIKGCSIPPAKRTSNNGGKEIEVRRNPGGRWHSKPSVFIPPATNSGNSKPSVFIPPATNFGNSKPTVFIPPATNYGNSKPSVFIPPARDFGDSKPTVFKTQATNSGNSKPTILKPPATNFGYIDPSVFIPPATNFGNSKPTVPLLTALKPEHANLSVFSAFANKSENNKPTILANKFECSKPKVYSPTATKSEYTKPKQSTIVDRRITFERQEFRSPYYRPPIEINERPLFGQDTQQPLQPKSSSSLRTHHKGTPYDRGAVQSSTTRQSKVDCNRPHTTHRPNNTFRAVKPSKPAYSPSEEKFGCNYNRFLMSYHEFKERFENTKRFRGYSKFTYGVETWEEFIPGVHPSEKKVVTEDGRAICCGCFSKHIENGEKLLIGKDFGTQIYRPSLIGAKRISIKVYRSTRLFPTFVDEASCTLRGQFDIDLTDFSIYDDKGIEVKMFYNDGLKLGIKAKVKKTGEIYSAKIP